MKEIGTVHGFYLTIICEVMRSTSERIILFGAFVVQVELKENMITEI